MSLNKVMLIGNVGGDPEIRVLPSGSKVAKFSLATNEWFTSTQDNKRYKQTEWHTIICWGNVATIAEQYVNKGMKLYVEGRIKSHKRVDKITQSTYHNVEILAQSILFLDKKEEESTLKSVEEIINEGAKERKSGEELPF